MTLYEFVCDIINWCTIGKFVFICQFTIGTDNVNNPADSEASRFDRSIPTYTELDGYVLANLGTNVSLTSLNYVERRYFTSIIAARQRDLSQSISIGMKQAGFIIYSV